MPPDTPEKMPAPPPPLDGELRFDEVTRKGRADDFGHIVHHLPEGVLLPGSADDVAKTIQWAASRGGGTYGPPSVALHVQCDASFWIPDSLVDPGLAYARSMLKLF